MSTMVFGLKRKWLVWLMEIYILMIPVVNLQIPIQIYAMGPQIYALPPQPPVVIPYPVPVPYSVTEPTTTTTISPSPAEDKNENFYVAVPAPYPVPVPVYPPQLAPPALSAVAPPKSCHKPACPPPAPAPPPPAPAPVYPFMPYSVVKQPAVVVVPFPPLRPPSLPPFHYKKPDHKCSKKLSNDCTYESDRSDSSEDSNSSSDGRSSSSESSDGSSKSRKKKIFGHVLKHPKSKRSPHFRAEVGHRTLVKPVLSYFSLGKDSKMIHNKRELSHDEAFELINENAPQQVRIETGLDSNNKERIKIVSNKEMHRLPNPDRQSQIIMKSRLAPHVLGEGKKEIVFKAPYGKKVRNLSMSFQIT